MAVTKDFTEEDARMIGINLGIKWDKFDAEQFRMGLNVELEHGRRNMDTNITDDDLQLTGKIALAHLREYPDYYDRLKKMEKAAGEHWSNKF